jgi:GntR family transcriptional regulator/MocR family aminotransferase
MQLIDIGDLTLREGEGSKQGKLFHAIREKTMQNLWPKGGKLPSTRKLAQALSLSRNTVITAYEQLVAEGYIESRQGSGFYVAVELPDHYISAQTMTTSTIADVPILDINRSFAPGVPDLAQFPHAKWQKLIQRHASRLSLLGNQDLQGSPVLRSALAGYLASSRSVHCDPNRIIITSGAQQALMIAVMATLEKPDVIMMEQPGYTQMRMIVSMLGFEYRPVAVAEHKGLDIPSILNSEAKALYITPSNQYPMGTTLSIDERLKLIEWAVQKQRWIIEDDYDSEFQFAHRPYTSLQGLAGQMGWDKRVMYVGSLSKVMFNSLRLGYLVVPESLVPQCLKIKEALSGGSPSQTQAALADFILEGGLLRHIRKMRRLYKAKHQAMVEAIDYHFGDSVEAISQAAGLHVTLKWHQGIDEIRWSERALAAGIIVRPLCYYEHKSHTDRKWHGVVLGYGNTALEQIAPKIKVLAELFYAAKP